MGKSLTFILLIICSLTGYSQLQLPFPDTISEWHQNTEVYPDLASSGSQTTYCHFKLYPYGKTTIDTLEYTTLFYNYPEPPLVQFWDWNYGDTIGFYRIEGKKIFLKSPNLNSGMCYGVNYSHQCFQNWDEMLLYDFDLEAGDTFALKSNTDIVVDFIDSVQINGFNYKRINFEQPNFANGDYYWIEGIGSSIGFFPYYHFFERSIYFNCFYENDNDLNFEPDISYYPEFGSCPFISGLYELSLNFDVFPNPTTNKLTIEIPKELIGSKYRIIDNLGRELLNGIISELNTQIDFHSFDVGNYFVEVGGVIKSVRISKT